MAKWNGEIPTIDLSDNEFLEARRQQFAIGKLARQMTTKEQRNAQARRRRARKRPPVKCTVCTIRSTCEKRKRFNLAQCDYGFAANSLKNKTRKENCRC